MGALPEFDPNKPAEPDLPDFDPSQPFDAEQPGLLERMGSVLGSAAKRAIGGVLTPVAAAGQEADKVTGAPLRAAAGAMQTGGNPLEALGDQLMAGLPTADPSSPIGIRGGTLLPTTPTGEQIAAKGLSQAGIHPAFAGKMAPMMGLGVDVTLDATNLIPGQGALKTLKAIRGSALGGFRAAEGIAAKGLMGMGVIATQGALPYEKAVKAAQNLSARELIFPGRPSFGPMKGAMEATGAMRAEIQSKNITVPGSHKVAVNALNRIREARATTNDMMVPNADKLEGLIESKAYTTREVTEDVPLTDQELLQVDALLAAANRERNEILIPEIQREGMPQGQPQLWDDINQTRSDLFDMAAWRFGLDPVKNEDGITTALRFKAPDGFYHHMNLPGDLSVLEQIKPGHRPTRQQTKVIKEERDLTLDELDDLTGLMDAMTFTPKTGDKKAMTRFWGPAVTKSRREIDLAMQSVPEGKLFKEVKSRQEDLMTAAKGRSKLATIAVFGASGTIGALTLNPWAIVASGLLPQTYYNIMGVLKIPGDMARTLMAAQQTGKLAVMREALEGFAESHPALAERLVRATVLVSGKPAGQQFLSDEEASTLSAIRSFDPIDVLSERERIARDPKMGSGEKAMKLSAIARNGYVVLDQKRPEEMGPPRSAMKPREKKESPALDVQGLIRSLETVQP